MKLFTKSLALSALSAAAILVSAQAVNAAIDVAAGYTAYLGDTDNNGSGNETYGRNSNLHVGEIAGGTQTIRGWVAFQLTPEAQAAIAVAETVKFKIYSQGVYNPIEGARVDLMGFSGKSDIIPSPGASEYQEAATLLQTNFPTGYGYQTVDITSFAKSEAANGVLAFRLEVAGVTLPYADGLENWYRFAATDESAAFVPYVLISDAVPEPASLGLVAAGTSLLLRRQRRV